MAQAPDISDLWHQLRRYTPARIALGRTGVSLSTARQLEFQSAHALARMAVHSALDIAALREDLDRYFSTTLAVQSQAPDRATYLHRPDLCRRPTAEAAARLAAQGGTADVAVVVCDGLSALAVQHNAAPFLAQLLPRLAAEGLRLAPLVIATQARVALADPVGAALGARLALVLIGERPGLTAADSMGLYLTFAPKPGRTDAERNCVSNIRPGGLRYEEAAYRAHYLISQALQRGLSGVGLKDETVAGETAPLQDRRPYLAAPEAG
jgi:ethanolamine ammonia-lyase small subunit